MGTNNGVRLGSLFGIPIILDHSFFISAVLITIYLGMSIFPDRIHPEPSTVTVWGLAVIAGIIFFISLLLHEIAHSLMARFYKLPVLSITLFLLGGVSRISKEVDRPHKEFLVAFVGPLTSAGLGLIFIMGHQATGADTRPFSSMLLWLGIVNISLAIFNMIPGFPLDGGRILHSLLWAILRSQSRATRVASRIGQIFGGLMALYGVGSFLNFSLGFDLGPIGGIWLVFIGAFLYNSASQSLRATQIDDRLADIPVRELMSTELHSVDADLFIQTIAKSRDVIDTAISYIVTENSVVVGMVSAADLFLLDDQTYRTARFGDIMTQAGAIAPMDPSASGRDALRRLRSEQVSVWPVVENGQLVGLVGTEQIAEALRRMSDDMED